MYEGYPINGENIFIIRVEFGIFYFDDKSLCTTKLTIGAFNEKEGFLLLGNEIM